MKRLVGRREGGFDLILEDKVRTFVGGDHHGHNDAEASARGAQEWTDWSCKCTNRVWNTIEASSAAPSECHLHYCGWLGSLPNLTWIYETHIPRSAFHGGIAFSFSFCGTIACVPPA